jgi:hypothetical protein
MIAEQYREYGYRRKVNISRKKSSYLHPAGTVASSTRSVGEEDLVGPMQDGGDADANQCFRV